MARVSCQVNDGRHETPFVTPAPFHGMPCCRGTYLGGRSPGLSRLGLLRPLPQPCHRLCWKCVFPISIGPLKVDVGMEDARDSVPLICTFSAPPPVFVRIGFGAGFLELAQVAEVVRTPFCSPLLGGVTLCPAGRAVGHQRQDQRPAGCLLSRALVRLPPADLHEPVDGPGLRHAGVLRHPLHRRDGPTLGGR